MREGEALSSAVEALLESRGLDRATLRDAWEQLSYTYRHARGTPPVLSELQAYAYVAVRAPATWAAAHAVMKELRRQNTPWPKTVLDVGAGPGTWSWAMASWAKQADAPVEVSYCDYEAWDNQAVWGPLADDLARVFPAASRLRCHRRTGDCAALLENTTMTYDWVVGGYVLGEMSEPDALDHLAKIWPRVGQRLILIEPGTPDGFRRLQTVRSYLLARGARLLAPCLGKAALGTCPRMDRNRVGTFEPVWCHFSARVYRGPWARALKNATLPYEDEPFCYLIMAPPAATDEEPASMSRQPQGVRIVTPLQRRKGHCIGDFCGGSAQLHRKTVGRSHPGYRALRDAAWGDVWYDQTEGESE